MGYDKNLCENLPRLQRAQKVFDDYDTDGSGLLSRSEFSALVFPSSDMIREDGNDDADDVSEGSDGKADASVALQDLSLQHQNIQADLDAINELTDVLSSQIALSTERVAQLKKYAILVMGTASEGIFSTE